MTNTTKLTLDDIADLRAYEREREAFRAHIIDLKTRRRVHVGPFVTFVFENRDTIRFQIQEMARVEKTISDEGIETELRIYNPLVPDPGHLAATLFIELTSEDELREWLPKLVGLQHHVAIEAAGVASPASEIDEERLTREDEITTTVHYLRFTFTPEQQAAFADGPVVLRIDHPAYQAAAELGPETRASLATDLAG